MAAIPEQSLWLHEHLLRIEKILLVIALGQEEAAVGAPRSDILGEVYAEVFGARGPHSKA